MFWCAVQAPPQQVMGHQYPPPQGDFLSDSSDNQIWYVAARGQVFIKKMDIAILLELSKSSECDLKLLELTHNIGSRILQPLSMPILYLVMGSYYTIHIRPRFHTARAMSPSCVVTCHHVSPCVITCHHVSSCAIMCHRVTSYVIHHML